MGFELALLGRRIFRVIPTEDGNRNGGQRYARIGQRAGNMRRAYPAPRKLSRGGIMDPPSARTGK